MKLRVEDMRRADDNWKCQQDAAEELVSVKLDDERARGWTSKPATIRATPKYR
jgi:hypothetical protein